MTRVLFVSHTATLGGAELFLRDLARALPRTRSLVVFEDGPLADALRGELPVACLALDLAGLRRESGLSSLAAAPRLARGAWALAGLARSHDVLYANTQKAALLSVLAGRLAGRPVIWHLHDMITPEHFSPVALATATACAGAARHVVANSHATARTVTARGLPPRKLSVVYNGFTTPRGPAPDRAALGLPGGVPLIGVFSRLSPWKGQHVAIEALGSLPGAHLALVGEALFGEADYRRKLEAQASALGLADRVHFLGFREDAAIIMQAMDVVCHTSTAPEPFGRVIVEGLLAGRPVIATDAGGVREILEDGRTGRLVPPGSAPALAAAVAGLLANPAAARAMAEAGRNDANRRFGLEAMVSGVEAVLARVCPPPRLAALEAHP